MAEKQFKKTIRELMRTGPGRAGLVLLGVLVVTSIVVIIAFPGNFGTGYWANPGHWADNPKSAPPAWAGWSREGGRRSGARG